MRAETRAKLEAARESLKGRFEHGSSVEDSLVAAGKALEQSLSALLDDSPKPTRVGPDPLVDVIVTELMRQSQDRRMGAPYVDTDMYEATTIVDGSIDTAELATAIRAALQQELGR